MENSSFSMLDEVSDVSPKYAVKISLVPVAKHENMTDCVYPCPCGLS